MNELQLLIRNAIDCGKYTSRSLATVCGCSHQQIYNILQGKNSPTLDLAERIFRELGAEIVVKKRSRQKISA
jgi:transcriptional regulator with XRE-family HTH domain